MAATVYERYGFSVTDRSEAALKAIDDRHCPFIDAGCKKVKQGGVCSIRPVESDEPVIVCPVRMYFKHHEFLATIAAIAFANFDPNLGPDGLPTLVEGTEAVQVARFEGR